MGLPATHKSISIIAGNQNQTQNLQLSANTVNDTTFGDIVHPSNYK